MKIFYGTSDKNEIMNIDILNEIVSLMWVYRYEGLNVIRKNEIMDRLANNNMINEQGKSCKYNIW